MSLKNDIETFEYESFLRFINRLNIEEDYFKNIALQKQQEFQNKIDSKLENGEENEWFKVIDNTSFLKNNKEEIESVKSQFVDIILEFDNTNNCKKWIDWEYHKIKSNKLGIKGKNWKKEYLESFPVRLIYDSFYDVNVSFKNNEPNCLNISQLFYGSILKFFFPIIINCLFSEENFENEIHGFSVKNISEEEYHKTADDIIRVMAFLTGINIGVELDFKKQSATLHDVAYHCVGFLLLHEYAHILLKHSPSNISMQDEIDADVFSLNVLLNENIEMNMYSKINNMISGIGLYALTPVIVMKLMGVLEGINNWEIIDSHPSSINRSLYAIVLGSGLIDHYKNGFAFYSYYLYDINKVFNIVYEKLGFNKEIQDKMTLTLGTDYILKSNIY